MPQENIFKLVDKDGYTHDSDYVDSNYSRILGIIKSGSKMVGDISYEVSCINNNKLEIHTANKIYSIAINPQLNSTKKIVNNLFGKNYKLNQKINIDNFSYTVNSIKKGNDRFGIWNKNRSYYIIDLTFENKSDQEYSLSSNDYHLIDKYWAYYDSSAVCQDVKKDFEGDVAPGGKIRGELAFEATIGKKFILQILHDNFDGKKEIFYVDVN